ncbi:MAG: DUF4147 domain-containing protein [Chloroflexia bacterium]|nr:DUF4147 domain-containing protein [Chloroflexia bacterium]
MVKESPTAADAAGLIQGWYAEGLRAVDPRRAVAQSIAREGNRLILDSRQIDLGADSRVVAVAVGKAACQMARGLDDAPGMGISRGVILTKDGHATNAPPNWHVFEASHPVPDERGVAATREILGAMESLTEGDVAIVLVSGGGSALLESPRDGLSLKDIQETTRLMLHAGAPIQHLNAVRSELSQVKGGGMRRVIGGAVCLSLIHSDVLGNDPSLIASGPTIGRTPNPRAALELLGKYDLVDRVPRAVLKVLRAVSKPPPNPDVSRDAFLIVGDNDEFVGEVSDQVEQSGFRSSIVLRRAEGEAKSLAAHFVETIEAQPAKVDAVIGGGEATVTVQGEGRGGRNTEFALAAAIELQDRGLDWVIASLASDGQDGSIDAAGAIVDRQTVEGGRDQGLDAQSYLDNNDSGGYFEKLGVLVAPGPTGANVNDVYIAVRVASNRAKVSSLA